MPSMYAIAHKRLYASFICALVLSLAACDARAAAPELRPCFSFHAFDHLHNYGRQAEAAAASGVTVIYATGLGSDGYTGLPSSEIWEAHRQDSRDYVSHARSLGIQAVLGYLCATSMVGLDTFDDHWSPELRDALHSSPALWRQQDSEGNVLSSWYGGEYHPACMNHPDWRTYQKYMVAAQIDTGHDGIFFDNPTVHPKGCFCPYCMKEFVSFLRAENVQPEEDSVEAMRRYAMDHPMYFKRFRCTIARNFLAVMREHARTLNPDVVVTANNSLNHRDVLFSQCHRYAYNLYEMSKAEDFVVIEDMSAQPRVLADGVTMECAPTYAQLHAIIHRVPLVAVTIAENDYHTPPNLVRLAMCEAAAHKTGYMLWSTWPEEQRGRMASMVRPCADWLRTNAALLNDAAPRRDVLVFLPFRHWVETEKCAVTGMAGALTAANLPYEVVSEERFDEELKKSTVLLLEGREVCNETERGQVEQFVAGGGRVVEAKGEDWLSPLKEAVGILSLKVQAPETVRAVVRDAGNHTVVFLYNLHVERLSSFEDRVTPAEQVIVEVLVPFKTVKSVTLSSADETVVSGPVAFSLMETESGVRVRCDVPKLYIGALLVIDKGEE